VRCDFCGSLRPRWSYPINGGARKACDGCRHAIETDDRETLLKRALLIPVPRTLSDRYAPRFREQAMRLHAEFWQLRNGAAAPLADPERQEPRPKTEALSVLSMCDLRGGRPGNCARFARGHAGSSA